MNQEGQGKVGSLVPHGEGPILCAEQRSERPARGRLLPKGRLELGTDLHLATA